jgi:hypothetical protein
MARAPVLPPVPWILSSTFGSVEGAASRFQQLLDHASEQVEQGSPYASDDDRREAPPPPAHGWGPSTTTKSSNGKTAVRSTGSARQPTKRKASAAAVGGASETHPSANYERPPQSYAELAYNAIQSHQDGEATVQEIYSLIGTSA